MNQDNDPDAGTVPAVVTKGFKFAHGGVRVQEFHAQPEVQLLTEECAAVAFTEKWARKPAKEKGPQTSAHFAAPEVAAHAGAPETAAP